LWQIALIGSISQPVTLTGTVVPALFTPLTVTEWTRALSTCSVVVSIGAGTEPGYLARAATASGIAAVVADSVEPVGDDLLDRLKNTLSATSQGEVWPVAVSLGASLADVAAELDGLWGEGL
jgi:hypothetical protein